MADDNVYSKKVLDITQIKTLMKGTETTSTVINKWPGKDNLLRLAKAVKSHSPVVVFKNGTRFDIKYCGQVFKLHWSDEEKDSVFIKPSTGGFIPCGYVSYKTLREVMAEDATNSRAG